MHSRHWQQPLHQAGRALTCSCRASSSPSSSSIRSSMARRSGSPCADRRRAQQQPPTRLCAWVGQSTPLAGEYHSKDYDWNEHAEQTALLLEQQWEAAPAAVRAAAQLSPDGVPLSAVAQLLASLEAAVAASSSSSSSSDRVAGESSRCCEDDTASNHAHAQAPSSTRGAPQQQGSTGAAAAAADCKPSQQQQQPQEQQQQPQQQQQQPQQQQQIWPQQPTRRGALHAGAGPGAEDSSNSSNSSTNEWEVFYRAHPSARFFKERRYLLLEFPCLAPPAPLTHVVEIGAGCGSSILPVLRAQPGARATVCDVSATCLAQLAGAVQLLGLDPQRLTSFVADGTDAQLAARLRGCNADAALIMFTLSAVPPAGQLAMMANAAAALRPGGLLCIRDHALYDMVQLRIPPEQCIGRHLYRRGDGTLACFYTTDDLAGLARAAGLQVVEAEYVCVVNRNRKSGQQLRRAFMHGLFRKPG